ncbi:hypothetical protein O3P69_004400 [Scylla paramamosain]|uniref:Uncharacterized protein n=1 Tax=Scylla paramamosain TaxID=85552 RepID=A0AAW0UEE4_SCYPA
MAVAVATVRTPGCDIALWTHITAGRARNGGSGRSGKKRRHGTAPWGCTVAEVWVWARLQTRWCRMVTCLMQQCETLSGNWQCFRHSYSDLASPAPAVQRGGAATTTTTTTTSSKLDDREVRAGMVTIFQQQNMHEHQMVMVVQRQHSAGAVVLVQFIPQFSSVLGASDNVYVMVVFAEPSSHASQHPLPPQALRILRCSCVTITKTQAADTHPHGRGTVPPTTLIPQVTSAALVTDSCLLQNIHLPAEPHSRALSYPTRPHEHAPATPQMPPFISFAVHKQGFSISLDPSTRCLHTKD